MDGINFIQDLAVVLLSAGLVGILCKRIGLSVIVGYLLAGILIGPHTPPFSYILDIARIETLSQVGLVFLMFAIGLGLSLTKLQKMGVGPLIATALGAFFVFNVTQLLGKAVGWSSPQSLFVAGMLMVSSSAVIAKVIKDMNLGHERAGQLALGITVLEDVVAVVMLAILGAQATTLGGASTGVGSLLTSLTTFVVLVVIAGLLLVPRLLRRLEAKADPELQTIVVAGVLFLMALLAVKAGYSLALGAFLLGAIVADMPQKSGVEKAFTGMRDMFSSVFFVAIGMMIDVRLMLEVWPWILGLGLFTLLARAVSTGLALTLVGTPPQEARRAGLLLMPLGEFTFVIAQLGVVAGILGPEMYPIAVGVSIFTVLVAPLINRHAEPLLHAIGRVEPRWLRRLLEAYHQWLVQLGNARGGRLWWQLSKKRLTHIALETLFITGVLIFSERILGALRKSSLADTLTPGMLTLGFWMLVGVLVLVPLIAVWINLAALARIFARVAGSRRFIGPIVENGVKILSVLCIGSWLLSMLPTESLPKWAWLAIAGVLASGLVVFSRRLLYWHGRWQNSLDDAFGDNPQPDDSRRHPWLEESRGWEIQAQDLVLPERAACSGSTIAELRVRSRFGCSIAEINRGGHTLVSPDPSQVLYSGDRLLLLGTSEQLAAARQGLEQLRAGEAQTDFEDARLETLIVPPGPRIGQSLAELAILRQTGVLVAGIRRGKDKIINPVGQDRLVEGDELLVLGSPQQIRNFKGWLLYYCAEGGEFDEAVHLTET
ncbi:cation:proton antiporter domain-containing protein [Geoalkalibacter sp.]|uniref:cation:proton antiporter domain-containing protein n=1 Tax=Geoalkalibacter sp. TaxID=3041440 RepID=UPI00272DF527|nr:cation:proton antiporter [Geoalkalibacter sp.]